MEDFDEVLRAAALFMSVRSAEFGEEDTVTLTRAELFFKWIKEKPDGNSVR
ncbi:MAG TPA: hypothetical protein PLU58_06560 [Saprospiraceae bacterium]|nr:hypothetical protein [Saprospiraceae bacterium]